MGTVSFRCPLCAAAYSVPSERISEHGLAGSCKACSASFSVLPDGTVQSALPPQAPRTAPPDPPPPPQPSAPPGTVRFQCPSCGKAHDVPASKFPPQGVRGACSVCGASLHVTPEGRATLSEGVAAPATPTDPAAAAPLIEAEPKAAWEIQFEGQVLGPFPFGDIKELIRSGRLPADRPVRPEGGEWAAVAAFAPFAPLFERQEDAAEVPEDSYGGEERCYAHADTLPTHCCSQCQRYLCGACVREMPTHEGKRTVPVCPKCGGPAVPIKRRPVWRAFYRDVGTALLAPVERGNALFYFGVLTFLELCKIPCGMAPLIGMMGVLILVIFQTTFYLHVVREVGNGSLSFPEWPDVSNFAEMLWLFLKVIFVTIVSIFPLLLVFCLGGAGMAGFVGAMGGAPYRLLAGPWFVLMLLLVVFYIVYLPVCIAVIALFNSVLPALNPVIIFKVILRIGPTYFLAVALWLALVVISWTMRGILGHIGFAGAFFHAPVEVYTSLVMAYLLGRVVYENEEKIGWS